MLRQALSTGNGGYAAKQQGAAIRRAHGDREGVEPWGAQQPQRTRSKTPNARAAPVEVAPSPPPRKVQHSGSAAVLSVLSNVYSAPAQSSASRQPAQSLRSGPQLVKMADKRQPAQHPPPQMALSSPTSRSATRGHHGRTSPSPSTASSTFGGRADALSGEIFRTKLHSIMQLREQIEVLAAKHKTEEEALSRVLNSIQFDTDGVSTDDAAKRSQEELLVVVRERDRTIEMLDTFRREGSAVIQRMHESLRRSAEDNEQSLHRIDALTRENESLRSELAANSSGKPSTTSPSSQTAAAEYERRAQMYLELLNEGDEVIKELRDRNDELVRELAIVRSSNASAAHGSASPPGGDRAGALQKKLEELHDQLRAEKLARLQSEEQSQTILMEHRRNNELLEQRLAQLTRDRERGTPRAAGGAAAAAAAANAGGRRSSTAAASSPHQDTQQTGWGSTNEPSTPARSDAGGSSAPEGRTEASPSTRSADPQPAAALPETSSDTLPEQQSSTETSDPQPQVIPASTTTTTAMTHEEATPSTQKADSPIELPRTGGEGQSPVDATADAEAAEHAESLRRIEDLARQLDALKATLSAE